MDDDSETFGRYGVRVPAIIVSPWVQRRSVSHTLFDHTSIIKTIVSRFCPKTDQTQKPGARRTRLNIGRPQHLGARVSQANHLGELLSADKPRPAPSRGALIRDATARLASAGSPEPASSHLTDLQRRMVAASQELTRLGHPAGAP